jgi:hypothetical protein
MKKYGICKYSGYSFLKNGGYWVPVKEEASLGITRIGFTVHSEF